MLTHAHSELTSAQYVVFVDSSRRYVDCSEGINQLLGYKKHELLQKSIDDISCHRDEAKHLFQQYLGTGKLEGEYVLMAKDLTPVVIRYRAFVFSDGCLAATWEPVHDWRELYMAAVLEVHPPRLRHRVEVALAAIQARLAQRPPLPQQEQQSIQDATSALRRLLNTAK